MQKLKLNVSAPQRVSLGRQGENGVRVIEFDCTTFAKGCPDGIPVVLCQRPGDAAPYPVPLGIDGAIARWTVRAVDTERAGTAYVEVQWLDGGKVAKSATFLATISKALGMPTAPPEPPVKGWVEQILDAASVILSRIGDAMDAAASALASAATATSSADEAKKAEASATASAKSAQTSAESAKTSAVQSADSAEKSREWAEEAHGAAAKKFVLLDEGEYDDDGVPTIVGENGIIYLVPSPPDPEDEHDAYAEWLYINERWERLGGAKLPDLDGVVKDVTVGGTSIVNDGVAEIPTVTGYSNKFGLVRVYYADAHSGLMFLSDGSLAVATPKHQHIDGRSGAMPIKPQNLDYAVKVAMCDGKGPAWTIKEQRAAQERMGILSVEEVLF